MAVKYEIRVQKDGVRVFLETISTEIMNNRIQQESRMFLRIITLKWRKAGLLCRVFVYPINQPFRESIYITEKRLSNSDFIFRQF